MGWWVFTLAIGAVIGIAFMLQDFVWDPARFMWRFYGVHPAVGLALAGLGGAVVVTVEFWIVSSAFAVFIAD